MTGYRDIFNRPNFDLALTPHSNQNDNRIELTDYIWDPQQYLPISIHVVTVTWNQRSALPKNGTVISSKKGPVGLFLAYSGRPI